MSLKIALIPLDDRPCNLEQLIDLAAVARIEVLTPPKKLLSSWAKKYDYEKVHAWIERTLPKVDALVLSLDFYLYGGLIHSRRMGINQKTALDRLRRLDGVLSKHPKVRVYLSNILLRLSVTVTATQSEDVWKSIFRFSVLSDQITVEKSPALLKELGHLRETIPAVHLAEYLGARKRNHEVNRAALKLWRAPDYLIYGQEDCAHFGLHRQEKRRLAKEVRGLSTQRRNRTLILTGADELGALLLMRAFMDHHGQKERTEQLEFCFDDVSCLKWISSYEDISVGENLKLHLQPSIFRMKKVRADGKQKNPCVFVLAMGKEGQKDACFLKPREFSRTLTGSQKRFLDQMNAQDSFLDLSYSNGANPAAMALLQKKQLLFRLSAFSAWNTTGNRIGTLVAHLTIRQLARKLKTWDVLADRWFLRSQLLDHWIYQSLVRPELFWKAKAAGHNPWALKNNWKKYSEQVSTEMKKAARLHGLGGGFEAGLPWARFFEARISRR